jgi:hypothetical protein
MGMSAAIFSFHSFFLSPRTGKKKAPRFLPDGWLKSLALLGLLGSFGFAPSLQATTERVNIYGTAGITDESGNSLTTSSIIRVGVFNNASSTTTPLTDAQIASLLNGTQAAVRTNLDNLFATGKSTLWGSTTVNTVFNGSAIAALSKTSTSVFAGNPIYILVFNTTSITSATQVGIFAYINSGTREVFPEVGFGSASPTDIEFDGIIMLPCLGSIGADGNYRLATIGNGYGITSSLVASATRNNAFSYFITANNGVSSFNTTSLPTGLSINTTTGEISGTPTAVAGTYNIPLTATGPLGARTATLVLTLSNPTGGTPSITSSLASQSTVAGVAYAGYTITGDNSPTSFSAAGLPAGMSCAAGTGVISGTPSQTGTFNVTIRATNASGTGSSSFSLTVTAPTLSFTNASLTLRSAGTTVAPTGSGGFVPTAYALGSALPTGLSLSPTTGIISGTPTAIGTRNVTVNGSANGVTASGTITISVNSQTPTLNSATTVTGYVGTPITYTLTTTANASAVAPDFYSILGASAVPTSWLSGKLNTTTGVFRVTPTESGVFTAQFRANNGVTAAGLGGGDSTILTVTFTIEVTPPTLVDGTDAGKYVTVAGTDYVSMAAYSTKTFSINGAGNTTASFSNLPDWLSGTTSGLNASVSGRPTQPGTYTIRKTISNTGRGGGLQSVTRDLVITVVGSSPSAAGSGFVTPPAGQVGQAYRQYITASGAARSAADPVSFNASGLPLGLSFATAADRQMGLITGTPTQAGTYAVKFYIANAKGYIIQNATMTILP